MSSNPLGINYSPEPEDKRFRPNKKYKVKQLWALHHEIKRRIVLGQNNVDIAEALNITPQTVSNTRNSPIVKEQINKIQQASDLEVTDIGSRIREFAPKALELLEGIIEGKMGASIQLRAKYASEHLGRAGYGEIKQIRSLTAQVSRDDIEKIKERAMLIARENNLLAESND